MTDSIFHLYHHIMCPLSRQVRVFLKELNIKFQSNNQEYWLKSGEFAKINPIGVMPVLVIGSEKLTLNGIYPIIEYLSEQYDSFYLMPNNITHKAMMRNYLLWFNEKLYRETNKIILDEKMIRLIMRSGAPNTNHLRVARNNLLRHMELISDLLTPNSYIVSDKISCADIALATHISVLDYFGEVNWDNWYKIRHWYSIVKSRPSFKKILDDRIAGFVPSDSYSNPDF